MYCMYVYYFIIFIFRWIFREIFEAISMFRTAYSYVLEPRPDRRSLTWFGYDAAHGA